MGAITHVCLSDLHLGEEGSILTNWRTLERKVVAHEPAPGLKALTECLRTLVPSDQGVKPVLVLLGDAVDLATSPDRQALQAFKCFLDRVCRGPGAAYSQVVYVPGNHDHHVWEGARETAYAQIIGRAVGSNPPPAGLEDEFPDIRHVSDLAAGFPDLTEAYLLNKLIDEDGPMIRVAYPNYTIWKGELAQSRCVVFTHGHFLEPTYQLMSNVGAWITGEAAQWTPDDGQTPSDSDEPPKWVTLESLEEENGSWIDFFWSTMGESGAPGRGIERVWDAMNTPEGMKHVLGKVARGAARGKSRMGVLNPITAVKAWVLWRVLIKAWKLAGHERQQIDTALSDGLKRSIARYVGGPLFRTYEGSVPTQLTLVIGHTHKPFVADIPVDYGPGLPHLVQVCNTGGWVVDGVSANPCHGPAIVVVDEDLHAVSVGLYKEGAYRTELQTVDEHGDGLKQMLEERLAASPNVWDSFQNIVQQEVESRWYMRGTQFGVKKRGS